MEKEGLLTKELRIRRRGGDCTADTCEDICEDIYEDDDGDGVIERCLELSKRTLDKFEILIDYLEEPTLSNLRTVRLEYSDEFADMLYVSLAPWVEVTDRIGRTDAESFLTFIAANKEIAKAIEDAQRNYEGHDRYEGFINLLKEVGSDSNRCFEYRSALCDKGISGDWRFQDIVNNPPKGETANADADKMGTYLIVYNCLNINGGFGKDYYPPSDKYTSAELHNIARKADS